MHQTRLDGRHREHSFDRLGEPGQPIDAADQDVSDAALLEIVEDLHPELRALRFLKPHPEHVALALQGHAQREVQRAALHAAAVADLQDHAIEEHDRVDVLQRPLGPLTHIVDHAVGDPRDQVTADAHAVDLRQVRGDVAR